MKVSIVGTVGLPACYGGWETLVDNIVINKSDKIDYTVYCSTKNYDKKLESYNGAKLIYLPISANRIQSIPYDIVSLIHCWFTKPDVVLVLGVSGCVFLPIFKLFTKSKIVTNVDGIEWKRGKWGRFAKWFLKLSEAFAVKYSDVVVADNDGIRNYIDNAYDVKSKVIAYGGEHALISEITQSAKDFFFTVCRIEPENNIEMVLQAFANSEHKYKIIGNWDSSPYGIDLKEKYSIYKNIEMIDPIYELDVLFELRQECKGYIHGHSVGGTNPSLVEVMHFSKPIYAFNCEFNRYTTEDKGLYFDNSSELRALIDQHSKTVVNDDMKEIAMRRYTWNIVTKQYENLYKD